MSAGNETFHVYMRIATLAADESSVVPYGRVAPWQRDGGGLDAADGNLEMLPNI